MTRRYATASLDMSPSLQRMMDSLAEKWERGHSSVLFHPDGQRRRPLPPEPEPEPAPGKPDGDSRRTAIRVALEEHFDKAPVETGYLARDLATQYGSRSDSVSLALGNMKRSGLVHNVKIPGGMRRLWYRVKA